MSLSRITFHLRIGKFLSRFLFVFGGNVALQSVTDTVAGVVSQSGKFYNVNGKQLVTELRR